MRGPPQDKRNKHDDLDDAQRNPITLNNLHLQSLCLHASSNFFLSNFALRALFFFPGIALADVGIFQFVFQLFFSTPAMCTSFFFLVVVSLVTMT